MADNPEYDEDFDEEDEETLGEVSKCFFGEWYF